MLVEKIANVDKAIALALGRLGEPVRMLVVPQHLNIRASLLECVVELFGLKWRDTTVIAAD